MTQSQKVETGFSFIMAKQKVLCLYFFSRNFSCKKGQTRSSIVITVLGMQRQNKISPSIQLCSFQHTSLNSSIHCGCAADFEHTKHLVSWAHLAAGEPTTCCAKWQLHVGNRDVHVQLRGVSVHVNWRTDSGSVRAM